VETGKIRGIKREPSLKLIYGSGGETIVRESGVSYIMDLQKVHVFAGKYKYQKQNEIYRFYRHGYT
jgi:methyltransferase (EC 2.1.1.-)